MMRFHTLSTGAIGMVMMLVAFAAPAAIMQYGDQDVLGTGAYASNPTAGATLEGLAAGVITTAGLVTAHTFPFTPGGTDFFGTDQIFVGSGPTAALDGYASSPQRMPGPQLIIMDYSALVPVGETIDTLTLGIAADDFQQPAFLQPYSAMINFSAAAGLTNHLNSLIQSGPVVQFFSIGINVSTLDPTHSLALEIDQGGNGGDGWAIDFLTIGVTTSAVPEPGSLALFAGALVLLGARRQGPRRS